MEKPEIGLTTEATCVRIIDGDTIEVETCRRFSVRLLDPDNHKNKLFGCAEISTPEGKLAKAQLEEKVKIGDTITLFIPSNKPNQLMDINTFNRILAEIWTRDGKNLSTYMKEKGYAKENQKKD